MLCYFIFLVIFMSCEMKSIRENVSIVTCMQLKFDVMWNEMDQRKSSWNYSSFSGDWDAAQRYDIRGDWFIKVWLPLV